MPLISDPSDNLWLAKGLYLKLSRAQWGMIRTHPLSLSPYTYNIQIYLKSAFQSRSKAESFCAEPTNEILVLLRSIFACKTYPTLNAFPSTNLGLLGTGKIESILFFYICKKNKMRQKLETKPAWKFSKKKIKALITGRRQKFKRAFSKFNPEGSGFCLWDFSDPQKITSQSQPYIRRINRAKKLFEFSEKFVQQTSQCNLAMLTHVNFLEARQSFQMAQIDPLNQ